MNKKYKIKIGVKKLNLNVCRKRFDRIKGESFYPDVCNT